MVINQLRQAVTAEPFRPFTILTADGRRFRVPSREFVAITPEATRTFVVASSPEDYTILDLLLVVGLEFGKAKGVNGQHRRRRA